MGAPCTREQRVPLERSRENRECDASWRAGCCSPFPLHLFSQPPSGALAPSAFLSLHELRGAVAEHCFGAPASGTVGQSTALALGSPSTESSAAPLPATSLRPAGSCPPAQLPAFSRAVPASWGAAGSLARPRLLQVVAPRLGRPSCLTPGRSGAAPCAEGGEQSSAQVGGTGLPLKPRLPGDGVLAQTHPRAGFTSSRCCWRCCSKSGGQRGDEQLQRRYLPGAGFKGCLCLCQTLSSPFFLRSAVPALLAVLSLPSPITSLSSAAALH